MTPDGETIDVFRGAGCEECFNTGYRGRVGIFELMELNEELRAAIMRNEDAARSPRPRAATACAICAKMVGIKCAAA